MAEPKPDTQIAAGNFPLAPSNHLGGGLHIYANYSDLAGIAPLRRFNANLGIQSLMALVLTDVNNGGKPNLYIWKESLGQYVEFNSLNIATISGGLDYEEMINDAELALLRDSLLVDNVTAANNSQFYIYSGPNATVSNTHLSAINGLAISTGDWIISTNNVWRLLKQSANALSWNAITGKPDVSINGHTHTIQEITDLADALAAKIGTDKVFQIPTNATSADFEAGATYEQHATSLVTIGSLINWLDDRLNAINSGIPTQITVDTQLDEFSTNAISNSAVFFEFENIYQEIAQLTSNFNDAVQLLNQAIGDNATAIQANADSITQLESNKLDKPTTTVYTTHAASNLKIQGGTAQGNQTIQLDTQYIELKPFHALDAIEFAGGIDYLEYTIAVYTPNTGLFLEFTNSLVVLGSTEASIPDNGQVHYFKVHKKNNSYYIAVEYPTKEFQQTLNFRQVETFELVLARNYAVNSILAQPGLTCEIFTDAALQTAYTLGDAVTAFNKLYVTVDVEGIIELTIELQ